MKTIFFSLLIVLCSVIISCKDDPLTAPSGNYGDITSFMAAKVPASQSFGIDASSGGTFTGEKGTVVTIPPYAFIHANGSGVTGSVHIELREVFTKQDMIYNSVFPVSNGSFLYSAGEYYIGATQYGETLLPAPGAKFSVKIPAQAVDAGMQLFSGAPTADGGINWLPQAAYSDSMSMVNYFLYNSLDNTYSILCDTIGWSNCDVFSDDSVVSCSFHPTGVDGLNFHNTVGFAVLDEENSVYSLADAGTFTAGTIAIAGLGAVDMHIVIISIVDGYLYYGLLPVHPEEGEVYEIPLTETTEEELDAMLLTL